MPTDLTTLAEPQLILLAWGAGLALVSGAIAIARIVGPGFIWLTGALALVVSIPGILSADAWWARAGTLFMVIGLIWARNRPFSGVVQLVGGLLLLVGASAGGGWAPAATVALALGGVTGEMMLSHWYLIDPRLPRSALRALAIAGIAGLAADSLLLASAGLPSGGATIVFWVLTITSIVLMAGVIAAIRYPSYAGVMAATGLSYLAVLTTLGGVFLGRVLVAGLGPFRT